MWMKALATFIVSETKQDVHSGDEFQCSDAAAKIYEKRGRAVPLYFPQPARAPVENKAASAGPLHARGGETGVARPPSSSPAARVQPKKTLTKRKAGRR